MLTLIFSHITAALAPLLLIFFGTRLVKRIQFVKFRRNYWNLQNVESLNKIGFWDIETMPEPLNIIMDGEGVQTTLQTISYSVELGFLEFLTQHPGSTVDEIAAYLGFSRRQINAAIDLLAASDVIRPYLNGYAVTQKTQVYLTKESPFFVPLPPPILSKQFLKILRSGVVGGFIEKWRKGRMHSPEVWAISQHRYSFPLGFALHQVGILKGATTILDVAGGAGSVCIALALKESAIKLQMIELPGSIKMAEKMISNYGLSHRIKCIAMDMFVKDWPGNFDAVLFTNIFHDWDDKECQILARKAFEALRPGGLVLIQEALLHDGKPGPLWTAQWSMTMAFLTQGRQFRASELKVILEANGFIEIQVHPLHGYYSSVVGRKPIQKFNT